MNEQYVCIRVDIFLKFIDKINSDVYVYVITSRTGNIQRWKMYYTVGRISWTTNFQKSRLSASLDRIIKSTKTKQEKATCISKTVDSLVLATYVLFFSLEHLVCSPGQLNRLYRTRERERERKQKIDEQLKCVKEIRSIYSAGSK